jgi:hypothetical protein
MVVIGVSLPPNRRRVVKPIIVECRRKRRRKSIGVVVGRDLDIAIGPMSLECRVNPAKRINVAFRWFAFLQTRQPNLPWYGTKREREGWLTSWSSVAGTSLLGHSSPDSSLFNAIARYQCFKFDHLKRQKFGSLSLLIKIPFISSYMRSRCKEVEWPESHWWRRADIRAAASLPVARLLVYDQLKLLQPRLSTEMDRKGMFYKSPLRLHEKGHGPAGRWDATKTLPVDLTQGLARSSNAPGCNDTRV